MQSAEKDTQEETFWLTLQKGLACKCPRCFKGDLFKPGLICFDLEDKCANCGLDFQKSDSADGPAVFLIFILGFSIVPLALLVDALLAPPLWVHGVLWSAVCLALTLGSLKPLKSYIITLQFKHRPGDWNHQ